MNIQNQLMGSKTNRLRNKDDFYPTPEWVTKILLSHQVFEGEIWEPSAGTGAISEVLKSAGYKVYSTDLVDRGYCQGGIDFLMEITHTPNIVTNPPFNLSYEFMEKAVELADRCVALLLPIRYLSGKKRCEFYYNHPPSKIIVIPSKVDFLGNGNPMMEFAWFIWERGQNETKVIFA